MSIFPFIDSSAVETTETESELAMFREYAYDYQNNELLLDDEGKTYLVEGNDALRIWIFKALATQRFRYTAYSSDFGSEHEENIIGHAADDILLSELKRYIVEALMVNPYLEELTDFVFAETTAGIQVGFDCLTIYGWEQITFLAEGVIV